MLSHPPLLFAFAPLHPLRLDPGRPAAEPDVTILAPDPIGLGAPSAAVLGAALERLAPPAPLTDATLDAARALEHASAVLGIDPSQAVLVRALSTVVFRVPDAQHGDLAVKVYPTRADLPALRAVLTALPERSTTMVTPVPGLAAPVLTPFGAVVSCAWHERGADPTWAEMGSLVRRWHADRGVRADVLPPWRPLKRVPAQLAACSGRADASLTAVATIAAARGRVLDRVAGLKSSLGAGVIHGDVSPENVLRRCDGTPVFIDFDFVAYGPREYDLVSGALRRARGEISESDYVDFVDAYGGYDVRDWPGLGVIEDVCELGGLTFRLWSACVRGEDISWLPEAAARWA